MSKADLEKLTTEELVAKIRETFGTVIVRPENMPRDALITMLQRVDDYAADQGKMKGFIDYLKGGGK